MRAVTRGVHRRRARTLGAFVCQVLAALILCASCPALRAQPAQPSPGGSSAPTAAPSFEDAETAHKVEQLAKEAIALYRKGRYREALVRFKMALALEPVANLLYNVARIYEKLGERERAIEYYERFVRAPDADPAARERARDRIAALRAQPAATPGRTARAAAPSEVRRTAPLSPATRLRLRRAGWALVGAGVAVLGTGVALALLARHEQDAFHAARDVASKYDARSRAKGFALGADVAFGVGGAALATGVGLLVYERIERPTAEARLRITPEVLPHGVGIQAHVAF